MTSVGIKELRDGLSRHLAAVRAGRSVTITDHGRPVARIVPVDQPTTLERLMADGLVEAPRSPKSPAPEPLDMGASVSDLVAEQRG